MFHLGKLISLFPGHFQNNDENDQYHRCVSRYKQFIAVIILIQFQLDLIEC